MKRLFMLILIATSATAIQAQVAPITTDTKTFEFIYENKLIKNNKTNQYILQIVSDNRFEKKSVQIKLGKTPYESLKSILNILDVLKNVDTQFNVQSYTFNVYDGGIIAQHIGYLEFTAGRYQLAEEDIINIAETLIEEYDLPMGKVHLECREIGVRKFCICYEEYGFKSLVQFPSGMPTLSKSYKTGDIISLDDLKILYDYSFGSYVIVKNEILFQRLCKSIFEE